MDEWVDFFVVMIVVGIPFSIFFPTWMDSREERAKNNAAHVCLFKKDKQGRIQSFHEARLDGKTGAIVEQYGRIGTEGTRNTYNRKMRVDDFDHIEQILAKARAEGYEELDPDELKAIDVVITFERAEPYELEDLIENLHTKLYDTHMGSAERARLVDIDSNVESAPNWKGSEWGDQNPRRAGKQFLSLQTFDENFARNSLIELLEKSSKAARLSNYEITQFETITHPKPD